MLFDLFPSQSVVTNAMLGNIPIKATPKIVSASIYTSILFQFKLLVPMVYLDYVFEDVLDLR